MPALFIAAKEVEKSAEGAATSSIDKSANDPSDDDKEEKSNNNSPNKCPEAHTDFSSLQLEKFFFLCFSKISKTFFLSYILRLFTIYYLL